MIWAVRLFSSNTAFMSARSVPTAWGNMERHRDLGNIHSCRWIGICHARKRDGTLPQRFTAQMMASVPGGHLNVQRTLLVGHHLQEPWHRCRSCFLRRDNIRCRMLHVVQMNSLAGEGSRRWVRRVLRGTGNDLRNGGRCRSAHQRFREVVITLLACVLAYTAATIFSALVVLEIGKRLGT
jgi:hypothetical protein